MLIRVRFRDAINDVCPPYAVRCALCAVRRGAPAAWRLARWRAGVQAAMCRISRLYHDADMLISSLAARCPSRTRVASNVPRPAPPRHMRTRGTASGTRNARRTSLPAPRRTAAVLFGTSLYHLQSTNTRSTGAHGMSAMWAGARGVAVRELR